MKSRRRDPTAWDYGVFWLVDENSCLVMTECGASPDEIEEILNDE